MNNQELKALLLSRYNEDEPHLDCVVDQDERKWSVYVHIVPKEISHHKYDKYYVGITSREPKCRWGTTGYGYKGQVFEHAIEKYGWNNIKHEVITNNLTQDEAMNLEITLIKELKSNKQYGYNVTKGGYPTENLIFRGKKVILLNTRQIWESIVSTASSVGLEESTLKNHLLYGAFCFLKDSNNKNYVFMFYDDYLKLSPEEIQNKIDYATRYCHHFKSTNPLVCLNTGEIFEYSYDACEKYNIHLSNITKCCNGERKWCGRLDDTSKIVWAKYNDYINMTQEEINEKIKIANSCGEQYIVDLETNKVYKSPKHCSRYVDFSDGMINYIARHKIKYTNRFQYYLEYLKQNNIDNNEARKRLIFID